MNGYNFTQSVRVALGAAREESARLRHEYVGTEHILLALTRVEGSVALAILAACSVSIAGLRDSIERIIKPGQAADTTGPDLPYTSRAKKVLELAMDEAREDSHDYVGTEHLLLGLLREEKGIAAQVLHNVGVTTALAREHMLRILNAGKRDTPPTHMNAMPSSPRMSGRTAAAMLESMLRDSKIAAVFDEQGVDREKLLQELRDLSQ